MELAMANGFFELSQDEMMVVDGGGLAEAAGYAGVQLLHGAFRELYSDQLLERPH